MGMRISWLRDRCFGGEVHPIHWQNFVTTFQSTVRLWTGAGLAWRISAKSDILVFQKTNKGAALRDCLP